MNPEKIKFLRVPQFSYANPQDRGKQSRHLPPLALGILSAYAAERGFTLDLDDLDVKVHHDALLSAGRSAALDRGLFVDKDRVRAYLSGRPDAALAKAVDAILQKTDIGGCGIVLLSSPTPEDISPLASTLLLAKHIKKKTKAIVVAGGGNGCSDLWRWGLKEKVLDYVVHGPGEIPLVRLLTALKLGTDAREIPGLCFMDASTLRINSSPEQVPPVLPRFEGLPLDRYRWFPDPVLSAIAPNTRCGEGILTLPFRSVIGCPFRCAFCHESGKVKKLLLTPPEEAAGFLQTLCEKHRTRYFYFLHSTFNFKRSYVERWCDEIIRRRLDIFWTDCGSFRSLDRKLLTKMRRAGAVRLIWGLETGSPRMLKFIQKGTTVEHASKMLKGSHEAGIWNGIEIICGLPHEKPEDVQHTIDFLNNNAPYIDTVYYNPFYIDGNSLFARQPKKFGIKNVGRVIERARSAGGKPSDKYIFEFAFDEVNGLPWEKKLEQVAGSFEKVLQNTHGGACPTGIEAILFYLYSHYGDKAQVKALFNRYIEQSGHGKSVKEAASAH